MVVALWRTQSLFSRFLLIYLLFFSLPLVAAHYSSLYTQEEEGMRTKAEAALFPLLHKNVVDHDDDDGGGRGGAWTGSEPRRRRRSTRQVPTGPDPLHHNHHPSSTLP